MEVTSSTATSNLQDNASQLLPYTAAPPAPSGPVVSTSNAETEGLNHVVTKEASVGPLEVPVRYGPMLPPNMYSTEPVNYAKDVRDSKAVHGSCGLYNLGNTCFMNAGLQSLMSCAPLVKFFCENYTLTDGNKHTLTGHFYILLCKMWSGNFSVVYPRKFKEFLGFYHSQFEDYRQHDCQEFLALLLDTLHEQLNNAPASNKHSFTTSPLPVTSSSSAIPVSTPEKHSPITITTASKSKAHAQVIREHGGGAIENSEPTDLNNKDSTCGVLSPNLETLSGGSDCRESAKFLNIIEAVSGSDIGQSPTYPSEGSPTSESSVLDTIVTSPSSHGDVIVCQKSPEQGEEDEIISSSFPPLRRYTSRSNLDDVTSSDSGVIVKPSLKRVSSGNSVTIFGPIFHSEDSNHSTVSAHSTDSEQSSAFKRLKIDAIELNRNSNNIVKDSVTSSSDCKKSNRNRKNLLSDNNALKETGDILVSSNISVPSSHIDLNVFDNMVSSCQEALCVDIQSPGKPESQLSPGIPCLDDFYSKETKTLNTNVVSEFLQEITSDSEKFAKLDNRYRPPSKEINLLQEAFGEEDKAEKVLIGHRFGGVKDTNLYAQSSVAVVKPVRNSDPNILNNSIDVEVRTIEAISKFVPSGSEVVVEENNLPPLKLFPDSNKLDEEEKNVQMQAYTKFNTIPDRSNIRTDLIDAVPDPDSMEVDEADLESSDEDEIEVASRTSTVEECSSVPNCLRHCSPSEVVMANRAWDEYLAKNDSIIVSTFQGQFRSTVVCSECSHVSVTYEPFMYLSLPIPHAMEQQISVVYISQHKPPVRYLLNLLKTDKIGMAKSKLCELIGREDGDIIIAEVLDSHISRILDNNILLKYVNTFNRKIYAFEIISMDVDNPSSVGSGDLLLNNKEGPSFQQEFELPSSSRTDLPYATDGQVSNQSFDSINVNSPSSRDTLDYMLSDSETCELSSQVQESSPSYLNIDDDGTGECQSTSGRTSSKKTLRCGEFPSSNLSWKLDNETGEIGCVSTDGQDIATSSSPVGRDDQVNSCTTGFWSVDNDEENKEQDDDIDDQGSEDETLVSDACLSQVGYQGGCSPVHAGHVTSVMNNSPSRTDDSEDTLNQSGLKTLQYSKATYTTTVTSTVNIRGRHRKISSSSTNSCGGNSSMGPSRSCPSPDGVTHTLEHDSTLRDVAARLEEGAETYFRRRSQSGNDYDFYQEKGATDNVDTSNPDAPHDKSPKWDCEGPRVSTFPAHNASPADTRTMGPDAHTDQWKSCAICLEELLDRELLTHVLCNGVFCQNCLEMSVKHAPDVSAFLCPICLHPANMCEDFVPLASATASKPKIRTLPMSIAYRHNVRDNTGSSMLQLFGHPNIINMPSVITGEALYSLVDRLISPLLTSYSIMLTDGQGLTCSRCTYSWHCTGCEIAKEGEVTLQPSDCLTVHVRVTLSPEQVSDMQFVNEDVSMAGLRSSEPTTIMDCFGAFTQSELLDEHNPWYCPQCERNQCAKKTMTVWRYPDNLIIHLKRFVYQDLSSTKVDTKVIFPQNGMDVRGFLSGPSSHGLVYDLYSIVCHFGGASAGHYTCYSKHPLTSQWYYYNDETVTAQIPSESEYSSGYVLYYQRHGTAVEFTPPQTLPCFDEGLVDSGVASSSSASTTSSSSSSSAFITTTSNINNYSVNNSMALVLFQPPTTSGSKSDNRTNNDVDDYDNEGRCSPCDYESLTVHFGSDFSGPPDSYSEAVEAGAEGKSHIAEPDSTLEFYS